MDYSSANASLWNVIIQFGMPKFFRDIPSACRAAFIACPKALKS